MKHTTLSQHKRHSLLHRHRGEEGVTLIELMVVVLVIGILAAIAIPVYLGLSDNALKATVKHDVRNTASNIAGYLSAHPTGNFEGDLDLDLIDVVETENNQVAIVGSWDNYTVTGSNPDIMDPSWVWVFHSVDTP